MLIHAWTRSMLLWRGPSITPGEVQRLHQARFSGYTKQGSTATPSEVHRTIQAVSKNKTVIKNTGLDSECIFFKIKGPQPELVTIEWNPAIFLFIIWN